jgi:hypothetical protein
MSGTGIICNHKLEEVPENDDLVQDKEGDEVNIDDEFEDIEEEDFEETTESGSNDKGT